MKNNTSDLKDLFCSVSSDSKSMSGPIKNPKEQPQIPNSDDWQLECDEISRKAVSPNDNNISITNQNNVNIHTASFANKSTDCDDLYNNSVLLSETSKFNKNICNDVKTEMAKSTVESEDNNDSKLEFDNSDNLKNNHILTSEMESKFDLDENHAENDCSIINIYRNVYSAEYIQRFKQDNNEIDPKKISIPIKPDNNSTNQIANKRNVDACAQTDNTNQFNEIYKNMIFSSKDLPENSKIFPSDENYIDDMNYAKIHPGKRTTADSCELSQPLSDTETCNGLLSSDICIPVLKNDKLCQNIQQNIDTTKNYSHNPPYVSKNVNGIKEIQSVSRKINDKIGNSNSTKFVPSENAKPSLSCNESSFEKPLNIIYGKCV